MMMKPTLLPNEQMRHINGAEDADAAEREGKRRPPFLHRVAEEADAAEREEKRCPPFLHRVAEEADAAEREEKRCPPFLQRVAEGRLIMVMSG